MAKGNQKGKTKICATRPTSRTCCAKGHHAQNPRYQSPNHKPDYDWENVKETLHILIYPLDSEVRPATSWKIDGFEIWCLDLEIWGCCGLSNSPCKVGGEVPLGY